MKLLHTEIEIAAPAERVWQVLTDFARFPEWNPLVPRASGELRVGARLEVRLQLAGMRGATLRPIVVEATPNRELRWRGQLVIPGLFTGEHSFLLEPLAERTRFVHSERFTGVLVPLFSGMLDGPTRRGFEAMNEALKKRVEG